MLNLWDRIGETVFGGVIRRRVQEAVKVVDDEFWKALSGTSAGKDERPWHKREKDLDAALAAWRDNPLAKRVVSLTTDYVLGDGLVVSSRIPYIDRWVHRFWDHPQNHMASRMYDLCDELSRAGELFIVLSRNAGDGMSYVRTVPAGRIDKIESDPDDLERELRYHELTSADLAGGRWWIGIRGAAPEDDQVMLHYTINRPVGCLRGESDLLPILKWLEHYSGWLEDRVRVNRLKSAFVWQVTLTGATPAVIAQKKAQYGRPPAPGSVIITNEGEQWEAVQPKIDAEDVKDDGKAIRLMVAAGAGVPLHFLSEGESATRATAAEMGDPTFRRYRRRQIEIGNLVLSLVESAYRRAEAIGKVRRYVDLELRIEAPEIVQADNEMLGRAMRMTVEALARMRELGWIDDVTALEMIMRAAGQVVTREGAEDILKEAGKTPAPQEEQEDGSDPVREASAG